MTPIEHHQISRRLLWPVPSYRVVRDITRRIDPALTTLAREGGEKSFIADGGSL